MADGSTPGGGGRGADGAPRRVRVLSAELEADPNRRAGRRERVLSGAGAPRGPVRITEVRTTPTPRDAPSAPAREPVAPHRVAVPDRVGHASGADGPARQGASTGGLSTAARPSLRTDLGTVIGIVRQPATAGARTAGPRPKPRGRRMTPAGKVLVAMLTGFLVWLLLAAPALKRSAEASPFGARRTAALVVLAPFDLASRALQLSRIDTAAESVLGRDTGGSGQSGPVAAPPSGVDASPPPLPAPTPTPHKTKKPKPGHTTQPPPPVQPALAPLRKPTKANPLTVLAVGDSIGIDLGWGLERVMGNTGYYHVITDGKISTGLARPDFFNWPAQLEADVQRYHPDLVVCLFGLNDPQAMRANETYLPTFSKPWFQEYARRVDRILEIGTDDGLHMIWAAGPIVSDSRLRHDMNALNGVYRKQVRYYQQATGRVAYFDTWAYTQRGGSYTAFLTDADGKHFEARTSDGIHLTGSGQDYVAAKLFAQVKEEFLHKKASTPVR
jgi:hypothetical protein